MRVDHHEYVATLLAAEIVCLWGDYDSMMFAADVFCLRVDYHEYIACCGDINGVFAGKLLVQLLYHVAVRLVLCDGRAKVAQCDRPVAASHERYGDTIIEVLWQVY